MPKETKFTLALMLFLAVALGLIVWQRTSNQGDVIASLKDKAKNLISSKEVAEADNDQHKHRDSQKNEPRKLPFNPQQNTQVTVNPSKSPRRHQGHEHSHENPFAQHETTVVAQQAPQDLFAKPTTKPNPQKAPKPKSEPFSSWANTTLQKKNSVAQQKPPANPFQQHFPGSTRKEAPKPNPLATGHQFSHHNQSHQSPTSQNAPFNPFNAAPTNKKQVAATTPVNRTNPPSNKLPDPFLSVQQVNQKTIRAHPPVQQTAQQTAQQPFDPFGNVPIPSTAQSGFPAAQQSHQHTFDKFPAPKKTAKKNTTPAPAFNELSAGQHRRQQHSKTHQTPSPVHSPAVLNQPTRVYTVKPDETYWSISKKIYGTIRYFQALEEHNRSRISSAKKLRPGMKVLVPEEKILLARYTRLIPGAGKSSSSAQSEQGPQGLFFTPSGQPMFRIGEEDTLSGIAHQHLGRTTRWVEIYHLNKDRVKTPDRLKIGTVLRLPHDASRIALAPGSSLRR